MAPRTELDLWFRVMKGSGFEAFWDGPLEEVTGISWSLGQAAFPCNDEATEDLTLRSLGDRPLPVISQPTSAPVSLATADNVSVAGASFRPASSEAMVARESPAALPNAAAESPERLRSCAIRSEIDSTATSIVPATVVVKLRPLATTRIAAQDPQVRTLAERIDWIQKNSGPRRLSLSDVARKSGLTPAAVSRLVRESKRKPGKSIGRSETIAKLAERNGVDFTWLETGKGAPRRGRLSARDVVLAERDWSEPARAAALALPGDRSADEWRTILEGIERATGGAERKKDRRLSARE
jgi:transcriptional regulator with XRE-family HTH domain